MNLVRRDYFVAWVVIMLALWGGMQFFITPLATVIFLTAGGVAIVTALVKLWRFQRPVWLPAVGLALAAPGLSALFNYDIMIISAGRLLVLAIAAAAMVLAGNIFNGLYLAGIFWPGLYFLVTALGWLESPNVAAAWSVVFIAVGLSRQKWLYVLPHALLLAYLGSRGAMLGALVAAGVATWPLVKSKMLYAAPIAPAVVGLAAWRWQTATYRLHYWQQALNGWLAAPWFGLGPGGLWARHIITEPGAVEYQIHAHNMVVSTLAECGIIGLSLIVLAIITSNLRPARWQWAVIAGLVAHGMVDDPTWWPGIIVITAMILGDEHGR